MDVKYGDEDQPDNQSSVEMEDERPPPMLPMLPVSIPTEIEPVPRFDVVIDVPGAMELMLPVPRSTLMLLMPRPSRPLPPPPPTPMEMMGGLITLTVPPLEEVPPAPPPPPMMPGITMGPGMGAVTVPGKTKVD